MADPYAHLREDQMRAAIEKINIHSENILYNPFFPAVNDVEAKL